MTNEKIILNTFIQSKLINELRQLTDNTNLIDEVKKVAFNIEAVQFVLSKVENTLHIDIMGVYDECNTLIYYDLTTKSISKEYYERLF